MTVAILKFLTTVRLLVPLTPAAVRILGTVERACRACGISLTVTCGSEGHPAGDPHTLGEAFDIGTVGIPPAAVVSLYAFIKADLGPLFYIQYEVPPGLAVPSVLQSIVVVNPGATGPHLHVQRARGTAYPPA